MIDLINADFADMYEASIPRETTPEEFLAKLSQQVRGAWDATNKLNLHEVLLALFVRVVFHQAPPKETSR